jgi:hypothetical protein
MWRRSQGWYYERKRPWLFGQRASRGQRLSARAFMLNILGIAMDEVLIELRPPSAIERAISRALQSQSNCDNDREPLQ